MDSKIFFPIWLRNKWWHTLGCVIFILLLSLTPQEKLPKAPFTYVDLVVHIAMYGGLAYCFFLSLYDRMIFRNDWTLRYKIPLMLGLLGFLIEILQKLLPIHRYFSLEDALCNFFGACVFYLLALSTKQK